MSKILFIANIHKHFTAFHLPYIKLLRNHGHEVHVAANGIEEIIQEADKQFLIPFGRSPFETKNWQAYIKLKKLIETEKYDLVTCHTSIASAITRIACINARRNSNTKLVYTVHGFDFSGNSDRKTWLMYYPMEKFLSRFTDGMVTINHFDYDIITSNKFRNKNTFLINGIGVNTSRLIENINRDKNVIRQDYDFKNNDFILIYIAEFIQRKNHQFIIESASALSNKIQNLKILFVGKGYLMEDMKSLVNKLELNNIILFLGFRTDIANLIKISDIGISSSRLEGLGLNIAEAQFLGLPVVASEDKGHKELIDNGVNGILYPQNDKKAFSESIITLYENQQLRAKMGKNAFKSVQKFDIAISLKQMDEIYKKYL